MPDLPDVIENEDVLDELLSQPSDALVALMSRLEGDVTILGVGGKIGVSLATQAVKAIGKAGSKARVIGVDLFGDPAPKEKLDAVGVETVACDLLDRAAISKLTVTPNVVYMAGRKFGTEGSEDLTWALNTLLPANVCEHYTTSRIVAFSTGCVYPLVTADSGGATEATPPAPVGEYAQSCLGRERTFQYYSARKGLQVCLFRLNYSVDLRYGVLYDIASAIAEGRPVNASVRHFNVIWQGDACDQALRCLEHCGSPAELMNVTGPEMLKTRDVATKMGELMGKPVAFEGEDAGVAYLSDSSKAMKLFGPPGVGAEKLIAWQADWVKRGGRSLGKPTHFEVSDGKY